MISLRDVSLSYGSRKALGRISLEIKKGEHVAIVGPNASGKTTLAMIMNGLLIPRMGDCIVDGANTRDDPMHARHSVGMVFQDPESQAVSRHVYEDVAFGPRNLGLSQEEAGRRVESSLRAVGMLEYAGREVSRLSGGQKQLLAIAGTLAMQPSCVIFDEPTALLDGRGSRLVRQAITDLKSKGIGTIVITHDMEEASQADRIVALLQGYIVADTPSADFFNDEALMARAGVKPPYPFEVARLCR